MHLADMYMVFLLNVQYFFYVDFFISSALYDVALVAVAAAQLLVIKHIKVIVTVNLFF